MIRPIALCAVLTSFLAWPVTAQDYAFQGFATDMAMATLHATVRDLSMVDAEQGNTATENHDIETRYTPSPAVSEKAQRQFIAFLRATSGDTGANAAEAIFARTDPSDIWAGLVAADGLKPGDAVDAIAGYWMLNWIIANNAHDVEFSTAPVREQVAAALTSDPQFRSLTEAQRQELSEVLMMNFLVQHAVYGDAITAGNETLAAQLGDAAVARFMNEAGTDLRKIQVTPRGFAPR